VKNKQFKRHLEDLGIYVFKNEEGSIITKSFSEEAFSPVGDSMAQSGK